MQTRFTLTPEDFGRYQKLLTARLRRKIPTWKRCALPTLGFAFIGATAALLFNTTERAPEFAGPLTLASFFLLLAVLTLFAAAPVQQALFRPHLLLPDAAFLSGKTLSLSDTALVLDSARGRSELAWSSFVDVAQDDRNHYLFVDAMQAVIVPKASVAAFQAAFDEHLSRIRTTR